MSYYYLQAYIWFSRDSKLACDRLGLRSGKAFSSPLSDHSPILTWLHVNTEMKFSHIESPRVNDSLTHLHKQFIWENDATHKFRDTLRSTKSSTINTRFILR